MKGNNITLILSLYDICTSIANKLNMLPKEKAQFLIGISQHLHEKVVERTKEQTIKNKRHPNMTTEQRYQFFSYALHLGLKDLSLSIKSSVVLNKAPNEIEKSIIQLIDTFIKQINQPSIA
ncbi:hypothetical protein HY086_04460 [Candidatus Gottesmanbacteria bacterium]|nr:hypothetical protein [Candidatus Gottesmanbacteria bacterium]